MIQSRLRSNLIENEYLCNASESRQSQRRHSKLSPIVGSIALGLLLLAERTVAADEGRARTGERRLSVPDWNRLPAIGCCWLGSRGYLRGGAHRPDESPSWPSDLHRSRPAGFTSLCQSTHGVHGPTAQGVVSSCPVGNGIEFARSVVAVEANAAPRSVESIAYSTCVSTHCPDGQSMYQIVTKVG
jgi:hypothetical protein